MEKRGGQLGLGFLTSPPKMLAPRETLTLDPDSLFAARFFSRALALGAGKWRGGERRFICNRYVERAILAIQPVSDGAGRFK